MKFNSKWFEHVINEVHISENCIYLKIVYESTMNKCGEKN